MKTVKPISYIIILLCSVFLSVTGAAFLFYSINFCYDVQISHFDYSAAPMVAFMAINVAVLILAAVTYFTTNKYTVFKGRETFSFANTFFSVLGACFSAYFAVTLCLSKIQEGREMYTLLLIASSFLAAIWFLIDAFGLSYRFSSLKLLSVAPALMVLFLTVYIYFNTQYSMNSPLKAGCLIMVLTFMLYYAELAGIVIEAPRAGRKYAATAVLSVGIGGAFSLALLATSLYNSTGFNITMLFSALSVVLWLISIFTFANNIMKVEIILPEISEADTDAASEDFDENADVDSDETDDENADVDADETDGENADIDESADESDGIQKSDVFSIKDSKSRKKETDGNEFYFEDENDDEDIYLPPVNFEDGDEDETT